jgi:multiple antibiotic resistance protein
MSETIAPMISAGEIFTLFFITLGPLKILGPFAARTQGLDPAARRGIVLRVFVLSLVVLAVGGLAGRALAINWKISLAALIIASGIIFFLVALHLVMEQYEPPHLPPAAPLPAKPLAAALQLTFPTVVTPYGVAGLIALLAATQDSVRMEMIFAIAAGVMVLNLLAMLYARALMHGAAAFGMRLLGAVLGVLQVALAVQIVIRGLQELRVLQ